MASYLIQETDMMARAHNTNKGRTLSTKGIPRPNSKGPRPQVWRSGPDPRTHRQYLVWLQQRNQANYRDEGWSISFDIWKKMWDDSGFWDLRGRERGCYCMTRQDWSLPWTINNVVIVPREVHARMQADAVAAGWRSIAQKRRRARMGQH